MDVTQLTLTGIRDAVAAGQLKSAELTQAYLDRIAKLDPSLRACTQIFAERAMQRAKDVDAGKVGGALAGVPIVIKDNMCTTFGATTCSSKMLENFHAPYDATVVAKLEEAGAVILAKTNLDEFAMGSSTENSGFEATRNPWHTDHVPGGSSGGSAAALAADFAVASIGSDTGGSIRQPAALCGVVGLKPTYGLVSRFGLVAFASSLDQIGPFAHNVTDAAALLNVIAGHDPLDSTSAQPADHHAVADYTAGLDEDVSDLVLGIAKQYLSDDNHPSVKKSIDDAIAFYTKAGARIVEVDLPHTEYGIPTYYIVATAEASSNLARYDGIHYGHRAKQADDLIDLYSASRAEGFGDEVKRRIMLGTFALSSGYHDAYYLRALKVRRLIKHDFDDAFKQCHAILCPTTTAPAFRFGDKTDDPVAMYLNDIYTVNANLAGIAGVSIPAGFDEADGKKLPLGLQLLGPTYSEHTLLRIGRMFEKAHDYAAARPGC
ncbi:MAG: Asp-tRNA(Asn)/Glu-tRNA(Gln) amidotransferase subunit GatA [Phycisphaeraceae bacterium]